MSNQFVQLDARILQKGMYPETDLFYMTQERPILLCRGGALIDDMSLNRLQYIAATGQPIFVAEETALNLQEQARYFLQEDHETEERYRHTKETCRDILEDVKKSGQVDMQSVVHLVSMVENVLDSMDASFLLKYTHYMDEMDSQLQVHSINVAILNGMMGRWMDLPDEDVQNLVTVGFLHDIGKIKIRPEILNKPSRLTPEEFEIMKQHPVYSYEMCKAAGMDDEEMLMGIRGHHEKLNGSGYPDELRGDDVSSFARLTAISDIYDAMISDRSYKNANTPFAVLDQFYNEQFSNLDMAFVDIFMDHMVNELNGKYVILTTGRMAQITYIEKKKVAYPIVTSHGKIIETGPNAAGIVSVCGAGF